MQFCRRSSFYYSKCLSALIFVKGSLRDAQGTHTDRPTRGMHILLTKNFQNILTRNGTVTFIFPPLYVKTTTYLNMLAAICMSCDFTSHKEILCFVLFTLKRHTV